MAAEYSQREAHTMRDARKARDPGIDLVQCSDGLYRTVDEKAAFDAAPVGQFQRPS